jgi:hypothetical protein
VTEHAPARAADVRAKLPHVACLVHSKIKSKIK